MIWIYTVCKGRVYPGSEGKGLTDLKSNDSDRKLWSLYTSPAENKTPVAQTLATSDPWLHDLFSSGSGACFTKKYWAQLFKV